MNTYQKNNAFEAPRSQSVKRTIINLLGVITLVLAIFVLIASFIPMIGEIAFVGGAVVILLASIGLYFAVIYGIGKVLLIVALSLSIAGTGISVKKFIDYQKAHASEIHSGGSGGGFHHSWGDDDD